MATFEQFNIKIPIGAFGNIKTICPACTPHSRKPSHRNSKDLSVNVAEGIWNCHNCGWKGTLKVKDEKTYTKPVAVELPLSQRAIDWFKKRGINENTLRFFGITEKQEYMPQVQAERNCVIFPYRKNNQWVNAKYRDGEKNFKMVKDAELTLFNYDAVFGKDVIMITEGEIDAMSVHEVGFFNVCSVPNGASKGNQRLEYLDNAWMAFSDCEKVIISTDNDEAGTALKIELMRRLGRERCFEVIYPDGCKDMNEVLVAFGHSRVWDCINNVKPFPVEGILRLTDFVFELDDIYEHGFTYGITIGYPEFDRLLNFSLGQVTIVTGIPNSGKSAFLDQMLIRIAKLHEWNTGVCSFENQPVTRHASNLISVYVGKPFYRKNNNDKMDIPEYNKAKEFLQRYFFWFKMKDEDLTIDGILNRAKQLVTTHGIKCLVIDPYNYMEHKRPNGMTETEYVSELLGKLCNFSKDYNVHVFLVAHPTKIKKNIQTKDFEVPNLYDISGSAHFFNKSDNGITVYRERATNKVIVYVQKVRFFYNGQIGSSEFTYDVHTGRYEEIGSNPFPDLPVRIPTETQQQITNRIIGEKDLPF